MSKKKKSKKAAKKFFKDIDFTSPLPVKVRLVEQILKQTTK